MKIILFFLPTIILYCSIKMNTAFNFNISFFLVVKISLIGSVFVYLLCLLYNKSIYFLLRGKERKKVKVKKKELIVLCHCNNINTILLLSTVVQIRRELVLFYLNANMYTIQFFLNPTYTCYTVFYSSSILKKSTIYNTTKYSIIEEE